MLLNLIALHKFWQHWQCTTVHYNDKVKLMALCSWKLKIVPILNLQDLFKVTNMVEFDSLKYILATLAIYTVHYHDKTRLMA